MIKLNITIKENKKTDSTNIQLNPPNLEKSTEKEKITCNFIWNQINKTLKNLENGKEE